MTMSGRLPVIDGDAHVVEPFSLWDDELPEEFRPVARQRIVDETGKEVLFHHGQPLNLEWTIGALATPGSGSVEGRLDLDLEDDVDAGVSDPVRRLEVMDDQGIAVSVLFPSCTLGLDDVPDLDFRWAYARTYNSWIARFCATDPVRLRWGAVIPLAGLDRAMEELDRCLALGASTVMLSPIPRTGPGAVPFASPDREGLCANLGNPELDPFWERLVEKGIPAVVHAVNPAANVGHRLGVRQPRPVADGAAVADADGHPAPDRRWSARSPSRPESWVLRGGCGLACSLVGPDGGDLRQVRAVEEAARTAPDRNLPGPVLDLGRACRLGASIDDRPRRSRTGGVRKRLASYGRGLARPDRHHSRPRRPERGDAPGHVDRRAGSTLRGGHRPTDGAPGRRLVT